jgi:hypothetical protein
MLCGISVFLLAEPGLDAARRLELLKLVEFVAIALKGITAGLEMPEILRVSKIEPLLKG